MRKVMVNKGTLAKLLMLASIMPNKGDVECYKKSYFNIYKDLEKTLTASEVRSLLNMVEDETIRFGYRGGKNNE